MKHAATILAAAFVSVSAFAQTNLVTGTNRIVKAAVVRPVVRQMTYGEQVLFGVTNRIGQLEAARNQLVSISKYNQQRADLARKAKLPHAEEDANIVALSKQIKGVDNDIAAFRLQEFDNSHRYNLPESVVTTKTKTK